MSNKGGYDELILKEESNKLELASINHIKQIALKDEMLTLENKKHTQKAKLKLQIEQTLQKEILTELSKAQNEIALKRVEEFRQKNLNNLNIPSTQATVNKAKLEDLFWTQKGTQDKIEYYFRNGKAQDNELLYFEDGNVNKGVWNFNHTKDEIIIELLGNKTEYKILELQTKELKLKYKDGDDLLELERV